MCPKNRVPADAAARTSTCRFCEGKLIYNMQMHSAFEVKIAELIILHQRIFLQKNGADFMDIIYLFQNETSSVVYVA